MSGKIRTFERRKSGHLSEMKNNTFQRITCIPVSLPLARTKIAQFMSQPLPVAPCSPQGGGSRI